MKASLKKGFEPPPPEAVESASVRRLQRHLFVLETLKRAVAAGEAATKKRTAANRRRKRFKFSLPLIAAAKLALVLVLHPTTDQGAAIEKRESRPAELRSASEAEPIQPRLPATEEGMLRAYNDWKSRNSSLTHSHFDKIHGLIKEGKYDEALVRLEDVCRGSYTQREVKKGVLVKRVRGEDLPPSPASESSKGGPGGTAVSDSIKREGFYVPTEKFGEEASAADELKPVVKGLAALKSREPRH